MRHRLSRADVAISERPLKLSDIAVGIARGGGVELQGQRRFPWRNLEGNQGSLVHAGVTHRVGQARRTSVNGGHLPVDGVVAMVARPQALQTGSEAVRVEAGQAVQQAGLA